MMRRRKLGGALAAVACVWALAAAAGAQASTVQVGVLPPLTGSEEVGEVHTVFNTALPQSGANLTSPVNGVVVRWLIQGAKGGPFSLRILRPNGKGAFEAVGTSLPQSPADPGLQRYPTVLPVKAGDLIGVDPTNPTDELGYTEAAGASLAYLFPTPPEGATVAPSGTLAGKQLALQAEIQPTPEVTAVSPGFGSVLGGEKVKITGTNLGGASAVKFGEVPATDFAVESETEIVATAPAAAKTGFVNLTVATIAGTSSEQRADLYRYDGCTVPRLLGKKVGLAKRIVKQSGCKLGTVKKVKAARGKKGKVVKQSPKPDRVLRSGSKVSIKFGA
jgi:hypothetical protein